MIARVVWHSVELALQVVLFSKSKLPLKPNRFTYIKDSTYYGLSQQTARCLAIFMIPSIVQQLINYQSPQHVFYGLLMMIDLATTCDFLPPVELLYTCLLLLRLYRTLELVMQIGILISKINVKTLKKSPPKKLIKLEKVEKVVEKPEQLELSDDKKADQIDLVDKTTATPSQVGNLQSQQTSVDLTDKPIKKPKQQYPQYEFQIKLSQQSYNVIVDDLDKFDEAFQLPIEPKLLNHLKLHYSHYIYNQIKKSKKDEELQQRYLKQIAMYHSELILYNY
ncbi:hypothetical protein pb186bvf_015203 [Paramecium bursaria]